MIPPWALGALLAGGGAQAADFTVSPDAQQTITWSGYVENQATLMALPHRDAEDAEDTGGSGLDLLDYNKLRLELEARPQPGFSANANIVARSWHGTTSMDLADLLPERFDNDLALLALFDPDATQYQFQNEIAINDAYFTARQGRFKLRMGKQQFRFGSGWFWNPTDPFTVKDLLDPSYEKQGVTAARLQLNLPLQGLLEAWALPRQTWGDFQVEDSALAFRARVAPGQWVFTASQASLRDLAALDLSATDMDAFMVQGRRHIFGLDVAGEVGGVGLWLEGAYNRMHLDDWTDLEPIAQQAWYEVEAGTIIIPLSEVAGLKLRELPRNPPIEPYEAIQGAFRTPISYSPSMYCHVAILPDKACVQAIADEDIWQPPPPCPQYVEALRDLVSSPDRRAEFGAAGRKRVEGHFTLEKMIRAHEELYVKLLRDKT